MPFGGALARVMVVDDEPMIRRMVVAVLSHSGYEVVNVDTPEHAMRLVEENVGVDLVTDVTMPNMSGAELAKGMTARVPELRVLFISGFETGSAREAVPGSSFLQKPFRIPELLARVAQLLA